PMEEPGFGVQPRCSGFVRDPHRCAEVNQSIKSLPLSGAHVGCGDHPQLSTAPYEVREMLFEDAESVPFDKGAEEIRTVRRSEFALNLCANARLAAAVDEQCGCREGYFGSRGKCGGA